MAYKILIVRNDGIGDFILSLPAMQALRDNFPDARIILFTASWQEELARNLKLFDEIIIWRTKNYLTSPQLIKYQYCRMFKLLPLIRHRRFNLGIDFKGNLVNYIFMRLAGIRLRFALRVKKNTHRLEAFRRLVKEATGSDVIREFTLPIPEQKRKEAEEFLVQEGIPQDRFCVIHPVARWKGKRWPKENFAQLSRLIAAEFGLKIIFVGAKEDLSQINAIRDTIKTETIIAAGRLDLLHSAAIIKKASLFVGNDAGPMHIAGMFNIPTVGLFGQTDHNIFAPLGIRTKIISTPNKLPIDKITVDEVFQACRGLLDAR
ncbi:MAG TPA: glycosyltransferase family 9 protein [Candidatus Omnitrophota bacterium]|nr:glycosyltransferase family 9 protein [Candidatus Omnitrophota bacterium]